MWDVGRKWVRLSCPSPNQYLVLAFSLLDRSHLGIREYLFMIRDKHAIQMVYLMLPNECIVIKGMRHTSPGGLDQFSVRKKNFHTTITLDVNTRRSHKTVSRLPWKRQTTFHAP
jgi:hypothetical protein